MSRAWQEKPCAGRFSPFYAAPRASFLPWPLGWLPRARGVPDQGINWEETSLPLWGFSSPPPPPPRVHHPLGDGHLACIRASRAVFSAGKIGSNSFGLTIAFLFPCISHLISLCQAWGDVFMQSPEYLCFSTRVPSGMD